MFRHSAHHRGKLTPTLQALSCRLSLPLGNPTPQITIGSCSSGAHCPCCEVSRGVSPREKLEQSRLLLTVRHGSFYNTVDFSVGLSCWVCFTSHCCMPGLSRYWGKGKYKCALGANWHLSLPPPPFVPMPPHDTKVSNFLFKNTDFQLAHATMLDSW